MPYRTDARTLRERPPEWLVQGDRRSGALAFLVIACVLGLLGWLAELELRSEERWQVVGEAAHIPLPGFDPGLTEPVHECAYFIPYRITGNSFCGTVAPFVIPRDPLLGCPSEDELRRMIGAAADQPVTRLRGAPWDEDSSIARLAE